MPKKDVTLLAAMTNNNEQRTMNYSKQSQNKPNQTQSRYEASPQFLSAEVSAKADWCYPILSIFPILPKIGRLVTID
jgi:hypothetical protein